MQIFYAIYIILSILINQSFQQIQNYNITKTVIEENIKIQSGIEINQRYYQIKTIQLNNAEILVYHVKSQAQNFEYKSGILYSLYENKYDAIGQKLEAQQRLICESYHILEYEVVKINENERFIACIQAILYDDNYASVNGYLILKKEPTDEENTEVVQISSILKDQISFTHSQSVEQEEYYIQTYFPTAFYNPKMETIHLFYQESIGFLEYINYLQIDIPLSILQIYVKQVNYFFNSNVRLNSIQNIDIIIIENELYIFYLLQNSVVQTVFDLEYRLESPPLTEDEQVFYSEYAITHFKVTLCPDNNSMLLMYTTYNQQDILEVNFVYMGKQSKTSFCEKNINVINQESSTYYLEQVQFLDMQIVQIKDNQENLSYYDAYLIVEGVSFQGQNICSLLIYMSLQQYEGCSIKQIPQFHQRQNIYDTIKEEITQKQSHSIIVQKSAELDTIANQNQLRDLIIYQYGFVYLNFQYILPSEESNNLDFIMSTYYLVPLSNCTDVYYKDSSAFSFSCKECRYNYQFFDDIDKDNYYSKFQINKEDQNLVCFPEQYSRFYEEENIDGSNENENQKENENSDEALTILQIIYIIVSIIVFLSLVTLIVFCILKRRKIKKEKKYKQNQKNTEIVQLEKDQKIIENNQQNQNNFHSNDQLKKNEKNNEDNSQNSQQQQAVVIENTQTQNKTQLTNKQQKKQKQKHLEINVNLSLQNTHQIQKIEQTQQTKSLDNIQINGNEITIEQTKYSRTKQPNTDFNFQLNSNFLSQTHSLNTDQFKQQQSKKSQLNSNNSQNNQNSLQQQKQKLSRTQQQEAKTENQFLLDYDAHPDRITQLGQGGFGTVFQVKSLIDGNNYAVKQMIANNSQQSEVYEKEIKIYKKLIKSHPNLMSIIDYYYWVKLIGLQQTFNYMIVLELAQCSFQELIENNRKINTQFEFQYLKNILSQCVNAMSFMRLQGIYHRDIKPGNILIMDKEKGHIKLTDYGISKDVLGQNTVHHSISYVQGSLLYMSPELKKMAKNFDNQSQCDYILNDIFSLGLTILQASNLLNCQQLIGANEYDKGELFIEKELEKIENQQFRKLLDLSLKFDPLERCSLEHLQLALKNM